MKKNKQPRTPSKYTQMRVTTDAFLARVRETEWVRAYETRLELGALFMDDPVYHPS